MYDRNRSGQQIYFSLIAALSGYGVTGYSLGGISGSRSLDGASQAPFAGTIAEVGCGQYKVTPFATDLDAKVIGVIFTGSGCVPERVR